MILIGLFGVLLLSTMKLSAASWRDPTKPLFKFEASAGSNEDLQTSADSESESEMDSVESERVGFELRQIIVSDTRRIANINGQQVRVGDKVEDYRVIAIESGHVLIENRHERKKLSFINENILFRKRR